MTDHHEEDSGRGRVSPCRRDARPIAVKAGRASFMPIGLFKTADQSVQVDYDGVSIPIPKSTYEKNGYKPDFDKLPTEDEYKAAQDNTPRP
jgi:hypothetical protein